MCLNGIEIGQIIWGMNYAGDGFIDMHMRGLRTKVVLTSSTDWKSK